jgi:hypothetical protein
MPVYLGPLSDLKRHLWLLRTGVGEVLRFAERDGVMVWAAGGGPGPMGAAVVLAVALAALGLTLAGGRVDRAYWPLYLLALGSILAGAFALAWGERFVLDPLARRWRYEHGWRWQPAREEGDFALLADISLERRRRRTFPPDTCLLVFLNFADGARYRVLGRFREREEAEAEAWSRRIAERCGLAWRRAGIERSPPRGRD